MSPPLPIPYKKPNATNAVKIASGPNIGPVRTRAPGVNMTSMSQNITVAAMTKFSSNINTYSVGFGTPVDETPAARETAAFLGTKHHEIICQPEDFDLLPKIVWHMDRPVGDALLIAFYKLAQGAAKDLKVVLGGEGADEAFAGYIWFKLRKLSYFMDVGGTRASDALNRMFRMRMAPHMSNAQLKRIDGMVGRAHAQTLIYHLVSQSRDRYFSADLLNNATTADPRIGEMLTNIRSAIDAYLSWRGVRT